MVKRSKSVGVNIGLIVAIFFLIILIILLAVYCTEPFKNLIATYSTPELNKTNSLQSLTTPKYPVVVPPIVTEVPEITEVPRLKKVNPNDQL